MTSKVEKAVTWAVNIANDDTHGYDQTNRWGKDYDCSALVISAFEQAGIKVKTNGATYTGNMYYNFKRTGFKDVTAQCKLSNGTGLQRGDVLLTPNKHTAIYLGNGKIVHASINENGKTTGGKTGDQTGKEICVASYYNKPWTYVLRYTEKTKTLKQVAMEVIRGNYGNGTARKKKLEDEGWDYEEVRAMVNSILQG